jgi:hypothetical protein
MPQYDLSYLLNAPPIVEKSQRLCWLFSIYNEEHNPYFWKNLELLQAHKQLFIVIDGGSSDATQEWLKSSRVLFMELPESTRGSRFNEALKVSFTDIVVFVHPRSLLRLEHIHELRNFHGPQDWGAFTHRFDHDHPLLRFTSWWSNCVRGDIRGIFYLDHILWAKRARVTSFPTSPIFEDTLFSLQMLKRSRPHRLRTPSVTSAQRFLRNGICKQILLNQKMKLDFHRGQELSRMDQEYEQGLGLNRKL